ncbi:MULTISPECIES: polyprenyl synthetase family protein [Bacillaceae]|nr:MULTISPECIES: farnesyl diphosphate synthase [Bacillaceae]EOR23342.1 polyprenyl synthetase [Niallia nealsonii AAU1]MDU1845236.1 polyprenyl synthetase family protein [Niallia nealsonii]MCB5235877.1 polyprenyl synthetase family protein [Niallia circulans]MED3791315.1 polyprenyl synthetase family protein [Niallia alba]UTI41663.1 polyprenyl synthetase family protein [Niallia sp. RD1]
MNNISLSAFTKKYKDLLEKELKQNVEKLVAPSNLKDSMLYSLNAGGKRIRPLLLFATIQSYGKDPFKGLLPATAIEMIHTYSLIHDDLPSMDDDDLRRGLPTNHKVYGEATAILAGDALLTYSFQIMTRMTQENIPSDLILTTINLLAEAAGAEGMVGGQVADIEGENKALNQRELEQIHLHKTGKLLEVSIIIGAILAGATSKEIETLKQFAYHLGLAFQIRDDILDLEGDEAVIGKPIGSDMDNHKSTYPKILTMGGAKKELDLHIKGAKDLLRSLNLDSAILEEITNLIAYRNN